MFTTIFIQPLYNALIFLVNHVPGHELSYSVIILTILFKAILIPLYRKQIRDQIIMAHLAPKLKNLQERLKDKREELARETMALYSKHKVNPFVSILILFIQLPFLIGLYKIFYTDILSRKGLLYSFIPYPETINNIFLSINLSEKSYVLAILAGLSQYILGLYMFSQKKEDKKVEADFAQAMQTQMKYVLPFVIVFVGTITPSVISLYLIVGNVFSVFQEILIKKPLEKKIKKELEA